MSAQHPVRVLLVDDHRAILAGLTHLIDGEYPRLQVAGVASSGAEAMRLSRQSSPDVILLDLDLGDENGMDLIPELTRATAAKVIVLTSQRDPGLRERARQLGAQGFVLKDEPAAAVLSAIKNATQPSR